MKKLRELLKRYLKDKEDVSLSPFEIRLLKVGELEQLELFVNSPRLLVTDSEGNTPLHIAVLSERFEVCDLLVKHGANLEARNTKNQTPLELAQSLNLKGLLEILSPALSPNKSDLSTIEDGSIEEFCIDELQFEFKPDQSYSESTVTKNQFVITESFVPYTTVEQSTASIDLDWSQDRALVIGISGDGIDSTSRQDNKDDEASLVVEEDFLSVTGRGRQSQKRARKIINTQIAINGSSHLRV